MKGMTQFYVVLSLIGILIAGLVAWQGLSGNGLSPILTLMLGIFFVLKEILDLFD